MGDESLMKKSLIIFDFDGTIADTLLVAVQIINELGTEFDLPRVSKHEFVTFKNKSVSELMRLSGLSWLQLPLFIKRVREGFKRHLEEVRPIQGMPEILHTLQARGYRMGILTSNTQEGVTAFLSGYDIELFEFIHAPDSIFGKGKMLREILRTSGLKEEQVIMIGDEARDVEAAHKAGVEAIAVTWGFNAEQLLLEHEPERLVHQPEELLALFP
jgi:phosphoglycolate phosphatase